MPDGAAPFFIKKDLLVTSVGIAGRERHRFVHPFEQNLRQTVVGAQRIGDEHLDVMTRGGFSRQPGNVPRRVATRCEEEKTDDDPAGTTLDAGSHRLVQGRGRQLHVSRLNGDETTAGQRTNDDTEGFDDGVGRVLAASVVEHDESRRNLGIQHGRTMPRTEIEGHLPRALRTCWITP